ncbi:MAG: hypothetical protein IJB76_05440 [Clostridia bacterium]|nr:hypothetical protein [Clostridia bacterium]
MQKNKKALDEKKRHTTPQTHGFVSPRERYKIKPESTCGMFFEGRGENGYFYSSSDPDGSYTGITRDEDDRPVQDVDDL